MNRRSSCEKKVWTVGAAAAWGKARGNNGASLEYRASNGLAVSSGRIVPGGANSEQRVFAVAARASMASAGFTHNKSFERPCGVNGPRLAEALWLTAQHSR